LKLIIGEKMYDMIKIVSHESKYLVKS